ncbi:hypothetical protein H4J42_02680 [Colwellia sp. BRX8-8]|nr:hypothetical protein [Colwellia sp. BRX8-8]
MKVLTKHLSTLTLFLLTSTSLAFAQTTIITNVQGYTLADQQLKQFTAIQFTDDKIDKLFIDGEVLPKSGQMTVIDGHEHQLSPEVVFYPGHR